MRKIRRFATHHLKRVCCLLPLVLFVAHGHAQVADDLAQMENYEARKKAQEDQWKEINRGVLSRLSPEDAKKYRAAMSRYQGKSNAELIKIMQADREAALAAMPPEKRKLIEEQNKKREAELKNRIASIRSNSVIQNQQGNNQHEQEFVLANPKANPGAPADYRANPKNAQNISTPTSGTPVSQALLQTAEHDGAGERLGQGNGKSSVAVKGKSPAESPAKKGTAIPGF